MFGLEMPVSQFTRARFCGQTCSARRGINGTTTRYKQIKRDGRHIGEHRYVVEQLIGRRLLPTEHVHHVNEVKTDNKIQNLEGPLTPAEHGKHHQKYPSDKACAVCGNIFTPHKTKRKRQQTCSPPCRSALIVSKSRTVSISDRDKIREMRTSGMKLTEIGAVFGITFGTVSEICLRKRHYAND